MERYRGLIECLREGKTMRLYLDEKYSTFKDTSMEPVEPVRATKMGIQEVVTVSKLK